MHEYGPRNYLHPCLLLLLDERPDHGYELVERLRAFGVNDADAGTIYRTLRGLERDGEVRSAWELSDSGPPRRTYELTERGRNQLAESAAAIAEHRGSLDYYLGRYAGRRTHSHESRQINGTSRQTGGTVDDSESRSGPVRLRPSRRTR